MNGTMSVTMNLADLAVPFPANEVKWRIQRAGTKRDGGIWAAAVAYIDNREIMERLDAVVGPGKWRNEYRFEPGTVLCGLSIKVNDEGFEEWVTKWDGVPSKGDGGELAIKGALSGAMKRAATHWGIGRYLYELREGFVTIAPESDRNARYQPGKEGKYPPFKWHPPALPEWALPVVTSAPGVRPVASSAPVVQQPTKAEAVAEAKRALPASAEVKLPGRSGNLLGYGGKPLREVPREHLPAIRDKLAEATGGGYETTIAAINEYLEATRAD
jgi:hypothetical protein